LRAGKTQRETARSAQIAVTYLSRLENEHVSPSVRTLSKIANALDVPVASFFHDIDGSDGSDGCPVSLSGRCILDESYAGRTIQPNAANSYSGSQLEILKLCNLILHKGNPKTFSAILATMKSLLEQIESRAAAKKH
jgi:transcriptional regulator with XRE-family HTH domain